MAAKKKTSAKMRNATSSDLHMVKLKKEIERLKHGEFPSSDISETTSRNAMGKSIVTSTAPQKKSSPSKAKIIKEYQFTSKKIPVRAMVVKKPGEFVPIYEISIADISLNTEIILESIKREVIKEVNLGMSDILSNRNDGVIEQRFASSIRVLVEKYFPNTEDSTVEFLTTYLLQKSLGMGKIEILMDDEFLEEIAVNSSQEPVWVYHRDFGWLKTTIIMRDEDQTKHYATMIGRRIGRQISVLEPLLDASLTTGDRVNATLTPISNDGNTITLRKFAAKPWTITDLIRIKTLTPEAASLIWLGMQYEMSGLISGGTGSGKTSTLNVLANFFPPNQRIISIEDTREIRLPKYLHWVPMVTRPPNPEGKGEVSMESLLINSLRQRPDRIIVGEMRRKREAEVLFEAVHTGHSVYATVHANTAEDTITRLTNSPIDIPKTMLPAISMLIVQYRNRRMNIRRTFQIAEITPQAEPRILMQLDMKKDRLTSVNKSQTLMKNLEMFTGFSQAQFTRDLSEKQKILKYLVKQKINSVDGVGRIMAEYYTDINNLMRYVKSDKPLRSE